MADIGPRTFDMTGQRFGMLEVIEFFARIKKVTHWTCKCDCGKQTVVSRTNLFRYNSCGCQRTKHGLTKTPEYRTWIDIKTRCLKPGARYFEYYGGRGIKVSERWLNSFETFLKDMGPRPSSEHSIERIDNDGDYEPKNCRWATWAEQNRNTCRNRLLTLDGLVMCLMDWSVRLKIPYGTLSGRIKRGWSDKATLSTAVRKRRKNRG